MNGNFDITISRNVVGINIVVPEVRACGSEGCGKLETCREMFGPGRREGDRGCEEMRDVWFWSVGEVPRGGWNG